MEYLKSIMFNTTQSGSHEGKIGRNKFTCAPGLRLVDQDGILAAMQSGWIVSYTNWETITNDGTYIDFKKAALNDSVIKHFANAYCINFTRRYIQESLSTVQIRCNHGE